MLLTGQQWGEWCVDLVLLSWEDCCPNIMEDAGFNAKRMSECGLPNGSKAVPQPNRGGSFHSLQTFHLMSVWKEGDRCCCEPWLKDKNVEDVPQKHPLRAMFNVFKAATHVILNAEKISGIPPHACAQPLLPVCSWHTHALCKTLWHLSHSSFKVSLSQNDDASCWLTATLRWHQLPMTRHCIITNWDCQSWESQ